MGQTRVADLLTRDGLSLAVGVRVDFEDDGSGSFNPPEGMTVAAFPKGRRLIFRFDHEPDRPVVIRSFTPHAPGITRVYFDSDPQVAK